MPKPRMTATSTDRWESFWGRYLDVRRTASIVWKAYRAMPKVAGPWTEEGGTLVRKTNRCVQFVLWQGGDLFEEGILEMDGVSYGGKRLFGGGLSREGADKALRDHGWLLIDPEPEGG